MRVGALPTEAQATPYPRHGSLDTLEQNHVAIIVGVEVRSTAAYSDVINWPAPPLPTRL